MVFDCQQCGECCSHLGLVHSITEVHGNYEFVVFNRYTNESDVVTVDADKHALFDDKSIFAKLPEACPFFRHQPGSEKAFCTVHLTRPDISGTMDAGGCLLSTGTAGGWAGLCSPGTSARKIHW